ncbi:MAG: tetratricopeptide repeat protein [Gammaproteobacteria bacterium]|nr:tetratricopeptide repeat protein [Gammaproteobacteria bacterium]
MKVSLRNNGIVLTFVFAMLFIFGIMAEKWALEESGKPIIMVVEGEAGDMGEGQAVLSVNQDYEESTEIVRSAAHQALMINPEITSDKIIFHKALKQLLESEGGTPALLNDIAVQAVRMDRYQEAKDYLEQSLVLQGENARTLFNLGLVYSKTGDPKKAEEAYQAALLINPGYQVAAINLGILYFNSNRLEEARQQFSDAVEISSGDVKARSLQLLGSTLMREKQYDKAADVLIRAIDYNPRKARLWYELGRAFSRLHGKSEESIEALKKAIALDESYPRPHFVLAGVYEDLGLSKQAVKSYQHVIRLDPMHVGARQKLADILESTGDVRGAKMHLEWLARHLDSAYEAALVRSRIAELDEDVTLALKLLMEARTLEASPDRGLFRHLGLLLRKQDEYEQAMSVYEEYMAAFSEDVDAYVGAAGSALGLRKTLLALETIDEGMRINDKDADLWFMRGRVLDELNQEENAINAYETCLELRTTHSSCALNLAVLKGRAGEQEAVVGIYERILEISPSYILARKNLALALIKLGRLADAVHQYEKILELDESDLSAITALAELHVQQDHLDQAETLFHEALQMDPSVVKTRYRLALLYRDMGEAKKHHAELEKTLRLAPDFVPALLDLGKYFQFNQQIQLARETFEKVLLVDSENVEANEALKQLSPSLINKESFNENQKE